MKLPAVLPDKFLKCMALADRKSLGAAGETTAETDAKAQVRSERELQKLIVSYLRLHGIEPIVSRMDRRTSNNLGTPDILFCVSSAFFRIRPNTGAYDSGWIRYACAWEVKLPGCSLRPAQETMKQRLTTAPNGWTHRVIYSLEQARNELKQMGLDGTG